MEGRWGTEDNNQTKAGTVDNKQERTTMKSKGAEGLPADSQAPVAANEEFAEPLDDYERVTGALSGWNPYDVWRTRVKKAPANEREADPRR
jgi:hypothetical protein